MSAGDQPLSERGVRAPVSVAASDVVPLPRMDLELPTSQRARQWRQGVLGGLVFFAFSFFTEPQRHSALRAAAAAVGFVVLMQALMAVSRHRRRRAQIRRNEARPAGSWYQGPAFRPRVEERGLIPGTVLVDRDGVAFVETRGSGHAYTVAWGEVVRLRLTQVAGVSRLGRLELTLRNASTQEFRLENYDLLIPTLTAHGPLP